MLLSLLLTTIKGLDIERPKCPWLFRVTIQSNSENANSLRRALQNLENLNPLFAKLIEHSRSAEFLLTNRARSDSHAIEYLYQTHNLLLNVEIAHRCIP